MTSAIRTSALISSVFTCEMASASRRTCNIRCFTQLFVVNMIARPIISRKKIVLVTLTTEDDNVIFVSHSRHVVHRVWQGSEGCHLVAGDIMFP